jgi:thiosulfate/3-mercaptopyruvate sulfurtransferase
MRIGDLGINQASKVVVYDEGPSKDAARIWWILRYWGVDDARLLNGGWAGWTAGKLAIEAEVQSPDPAAFTAMPHAARLATKNQLLEALQTRSLQVVDARSEGECCGTDKLTNKRAGAMPGAKNLEWSDLIDRETQRFKPPAAIRDLFERSGIDVERPTATHCQGGGRSSVMAFGLELMGAKEVQNCYRGWREWGNDDDTPVEPGKAKAK